MSACPPSALETAIALRSGEISSTELVEAALARVEKLDPLLGAFVRLTPDRARRHARRIDRQLAGGAADGPVFLGVPSGIKDIDVTAFDFTRLGSRAWRFLWSPFDTEVPRRYRTGGFVILGKLATSEFAVMPITETDVHPPCRNPWALDHTPGGSSGGSASAVAAGLIPIAHASDGGGSIRVPAAFCHLFGFKPSRGLLPDFYHAIDPVGMSQVNSVSHTVADSAATLDVFAGRAYDPRTPPADTLLAASARTPGRLRIAFTTTSPLAEVDPELTDAVRHTAALLESLGHAVEERPMIEAGVSDFLPIYGHLMGRIPVLRESLLQPATRYVRAAGRTVSRADAQAMGADLGGRVADWFGDFDLWLTPTTAVLPPRVGAWRELSGEEAFGRAVPIGVFTAVFNIGGQPAASLPAGFSRDGLPLGVQLAAPVGADAQLLAACRQLEEARPWRCPLPELPAG